ncbi:hypothetical protein [Azospirillum agricola]|uniref:hypothetical protein n=1 Tax=Azospirillum agricola TaxID=1720247 RepID=UPI001178A031|nr:hypothetical protein [Azospirillum agricola]
MSMGAAAPPGIPIPNASPDEHGQAEVAKAPRTRLRHAPIRRLDGRVADSTSATTPILGSANNEKPGSSQTSRAFGDGVVQSMKMARVFGSVWFGEFCDVWF